MDYVTHVLDAPGPPKGMLCTYKAVISYAQNLFHTEITSLIP